MSEVKVNKISPRTNCGTTQLGDAGDTITVTGDLKSNSLKPATGTTLTLGASGDTITLAAGASQTGFGRTGTVDWDTTAKTASFTAVSGTGYFVNTTSGAITVTLPASPSAGDIISVKDYAYTFATNNLTVARNGSPIGGGTGADPVYATNGTVLTFIYVDGTKGWLVTNESTDTSQAITNTFITATGGTILTCGDYKIHTFTSPGTFCVSAAEGPVAVADYLVVAGGGGGGGDDGGGGGAGGYRESHLATTSGCYTASPVASSTSLPISVSAYPVTVGAGGAGSPVNGSNGSNSVFSSITSAGGGLGGRTPVAGGPGGSGGGGGGGAAGAGGTGNTPSVTPAQGSNGGNATPANNGGGGGGGATAIGGNGSGCGSGANAGPGGAGATTNITASSVTRAGGGGGGAFQTKGNAGPGGGGCGAQYPNTQATAGTANTGGGGGGGSTSTGPRTGQAGGSGIVVIRYKFQ